MVTRHQGGGRGASTEPGGVRVHENLSL